MSLSTAVQRFFAASLLFASASAIAGGGVILRSDACIITIDFYTAHFTAYQPATSGNTEFCKDLPDTGETIFVLDYLHDSLKEVPVEFRIIRDVSGKGEFVRLEDVLAIGDLDSQTVYYREPTVEPEGSYRVKLNFSDAGDYVGIVTAGHPTSAKTYTAVFAFGVGKTKYPLWLLYIAVAALFVLLIRYAYVSMSKAGG